MTQTIEYVVAVKGAQQATSAIALIEKGWQQAGVAASTTSKAFENVAAGAKNLQQKMAPAAAAISGVGSALGNSTGQVGKFVNAAAQGAAAFGAGGPLGLAIVGATLAIDEYAKVTKESDAALAVWRERLTMVTPAMAHTRDIVRDLADEAKRLGVETLNAGKTQYEVAIRTAGVEKAVLEAKIANIEASDRLRQAAVNEAQSAFESAKMRGRGVDEARARLDEALAVQAMVSRNAQEYRGQVASLEDSVWKIADAWVATETATKAAVRAAGGRSTDGGSAVFDETSFANTDNDVEARKREARREAEDRAFDARAKLNADRINAEIAAEKDKNQRIADTEEMFANMRYEQAKANAERMTGLLASHGQQAAAAVGEFAVAAAMGQEAALERLIAAASQQAGGYVMLEGGKVMATGIAGMLAAPNPLSAGQIAGGAALVAAGAAIQTGGPAAVSALMGKGGASTNTGPTGSTRDPGASPRSSGASSGSGGPLIVNVTYGAGGPLPEDVGREIYRATRSNDRRSGR
jgi:hypothetical protein